MPEFNVPVSAITSARAAALIGAELLQHNLDSSRFKDDRIGVCSTFARLRNAVNEAGIRVREREQKLNAIQKAQNKFNELFRPEYAVGYWMGPKMQRADQNRRINALLTTAERV